VYQLGSICLAEKSVVEFGDVVWLWQTAHCQMKGPRRIRGPTMLEFIGYGARAHPWRLLRATSQSPPCQCHCLRYPSRRVDFFWHIDVLCNAQLFQHKHWGLVPAKDQLKTLRDDDLVAVFQPSCWRWQHRGRRDGCHLQKRARLASILHAGKKQLYVHKFQQKSRS